MASDADLMDAVAAGDAERVTALLAEDPALAEARGADGVSALLLARYRFDRPVMDALLAADPDIDVFEAAALGRIDRLRERIDDDPGAVRRSRRTGSRRSTSRRSSARPRPPGS